MRGGAAYFLEPSEPAQRRYEAMRAYFVDGLAAGEVAERFGYSPASVHQMASELRVGSAQYFRSSKPGPRSARKADRVRDRVLELRALDHSVEEIAAELVTAGTPVSAQTVWTILHAEGIERLPRRAGSERGAPPRLAAVKARALADWPADRQVRCDQRRPVPARSRDRTARALTARRVLWLPVNDGALSVALARVAAGTQVRADPARKPRARAR